MKFLISLAFSLLASQLTYATSLKPLIYDCATDGTAAELTMTLFTNPNYASYVEFTEPQREKLFFWSEMLTASAIKNLVSGKELTLIAQAENSNSSGGGYTDAGMIYFKKSTKAAKTREVLLSAYGLVYLLNCQMK